MNRSLKVGDRVKIISLKEIANSPKIGFIESMKEYCGKEAIIKRKIKFEEQKIEYYKNCHHYYLMKMVTKTG